MVKLHFRVELDELSPHTFPLLETLAGPAPSCTKPGCNIPVRKSAGYCSPAHKREDLAVFSITSPIYIVWDSGSIELDMSPLALAFSFRSRYQPAPAYPPLPIHSASCLTAPCHTLPAAFVP